MDEQSEPDCCCLKSLRAARGVGSKNDIDYQIMESFGQEMAKAMKEGFHSDRFLRSLKGVEDSARHDDAGKAEEKHDDDNESEHQNMADAVRGKPDYCCPNTNPERAPMKDVPKSFYDARAALLGGREVTMREICEGKVTIVVNTASFCGLTVTEYTQMNELIDRFPPEKFVILAFPCNQFCFEENAWGKDEILNMLKYVRPGNGYVPKAVMFERCDVNGGNAHPLYEYLKRELPCAEDEPYHIIRNEAMLYWDPIFRYDIASNFEKFLIDQCGRVLHRYSPLYQIKHLGDEVCKLLKNSSQEKAEARETSIEHLLTQLHDESSKTETSERLQSQKSQRQTSSRKLEAEEVDEVSKIDVTEASQSMEDDTEASQKDISDKSDQQNEVQARESFDTEMPEGAQLSRTQLSSAPSFTRSCLPCCYRPCYQTMCSCPRPVQQMRQFCSRQLCPSCVQAVAYGRPPPSEFHNDAARQYYACSPSSCCTSLTSPAHHGGGYRSQDREQLMDSHSEMDERASRSRTKLADAEQYFESPERQRKHPRRRSRSQQGSSRKHRRRHDSGADVEQPAAAPCGDDSSALRVIREWQRRLEKRRRLEQKISALEGYEDFSDDEERQGSPKHRRRH